LLTEARVLLFYMWQILLPSNAQLGLYHDDFAISRGWLQPFSTMLAVIGIAGFFAVAFLLRKKAPLVAFGLLFFLAGHTLESTIFPLEIAHEHRNYLPMYGIVLVVFYYLLHPLVQVKSLRARHVFAVLLIGLFAFITYARASNWSNPYDQFQAEFLHHTDSAMVNVEMGAIYGNIVSPDADVMAKNYRMARGHYERAERLDSNDTKALFGLILLNAGRGMIVEPEWLKELGSRLERAPFAPISSDKLVELTRCELEGACRLVYTELEDLLKSALRNPTLTGPNQAKVLFALSTYTINVLGDYPAALQLMHKMMDVAPQETASRIALINFLIALQRPDEAREQLNLLKEMKSGADMSAQILSFERELSSGDPDAAPD
ncbi:MAG: tetratricopeptide repeat protein, partial [Gallionella sp.]